MMVPSRSKIRPGHRPEKANDRERPAHGCGGDFGERRCQGTRWRYPSWPSTSPNALVNCFGATLKFECNQRFRFE